jgi:MFS family permease
MQGLGAGGIMPLAFILIGEMFSLEQRAKMQGLFSGVWGVSSIVGPLLGGYLVDQLSWRWVFYVNIIPGPIALALVVLAWKEQHDRHEKPIVDYAGAILLTASVVLLLLGLMGSSNSILLITIAVALFILLIWVENRATDPILPLPLFRDGLFSISVLHGVLTGWALFGSISFIPLFVQSVLGTSAMQAGITITPMLLGWVTASIVGMRMIITVGHRKLGMAGTALFVVGALLMATIGASTSQTLVMVYVTLMGIGMGMSIPSFLVAVQTSVERRHLGAATSMLQFSRSMGGTLGVSVMGAALSAKLSSTLAASGLDPKLVDQLLDPLSTPQVVIDQGVRLAMADAIHLVFIIASVAAVLALIAVIFTPRKELQESVPIPAASPE